MYRSEESKILFGAVTVGLKAQFEDLDPELPRNLLAWAKRALPEDNETRQRLTEEVARYEAIRRQPEALAEWGRALRDLALHLSRRPADFNRSDIHG